jgi:hypothetical protein
MQLAEVVERLAQAAVIAEIALQCAALFERGKRRLPSMLVPVHDADVIHAEATWCHKGGKIIFTSVRDGSTTTSTVSPGL